MTNKQTDIHSDGWTDKQTYDTFCKLQLSSDVILKTKPTLTTTTTGSEKKKYCKNNIK